MEGALQILLLGPPDVLWEGQSLKITRRMPRALLFYLAVEGRVSRNDLRWLFWPEEEDEEKARANLRVAINRLRASLPDATLVVVTPEALDLDRERVVVDVTQFNRLCEPAMRLAAQIPLETRLPESVVRPMQDAARIWRSPRFLPGFSFADDSPELDHWQATMARQLEELQLRLKSRLADHFAAAGDLDSALRWIKDALDVDIWADELHARALRWRIALGRTSAAAGYARFLQNHYHDEEMEFSTELAQWVEQALTNDQQPAVPENLGWPAAMLVQVPLIERTSELVMLQTSFRRGGLVLVLGEAGSGKTRLAYEFHRFLQPHPRLLLLNCVRGEESLPFQPLIDALRRTIRQEEWQRLKPSWYQQLVPLLPELARPAGGAPAQGLAAEIQRGHIYEALRQLFVEISYTGRLLVVLDNAQWCDEATLAALAFLTERRFFADHGLLLVAARGEEKSAALVQWINLQRSAAFFLQLFLPAFGTEEATELALRVLHQPLARAMIEQLVKDTGGNPLFLLETLFAMREVAPSASQDIEAIRRLVGSSLHHLLHERLERLQPAVRQVLAAAAVLDGDFSPAQLAEVSLLDADTVAQALDDLSEANLIHAVLGPSEASYAFNHGQTRQVIQWEMGAGRLRLLHLRAARALAAHPNGTGQDAARLARHYELAGEHLPAFRAWLKAGRLAYAAFSATEAIQFFQAAERLINSLGNSLPVEEIYQLYHAWGEITLDNGDLEAIQQVYSRLLREGEERHSPLLVGCGLSGLANHALFQNDVLHAHDLFNRAQYHLEQQPDLAARAQSYSDFGWILNVQANCREAVEVLEKARTLLNGTDGAQLQQTRALIEYRLGTAYSAYGQPARAQEMAANLLRQEKSPALMYGNLAMAGAKYYLGDLPAILEHARLGLKIAEELGAQSIVSFLLAYQMRAELTLGQLDAAWKHGRAALKLEQNKLSSRGMCFYLTILGDLYQQLGHLPLAISSYQDALAIGTWKWDTLSCQYRLGKALAEAGQSEQGLGLVEDAYEQARRFEMAAVYIPAANARALLLAGMGRLAEAVAIVSESKRQGHDRNFLNTGIVEDRVLSQQALAKGERAEAGRFLESAIREARQIGDPFNELAGYQLLLALGPLGPAALERVNGLLDALERNGRLPEVAQMVRPFVAGMRELFRNGAAKKF